MGREHPARGHWEICFGSNPGKEKCFQLQILKDITFHFRNSKCLQQEERVPNQYAGKCQN
jgi:hypothetical protein